MKGDDKVTPLSSLAFRFSIWYSRLKDPNDSTEIVSPAYLDHFIMSTICCVRDASDIDIDDERIKWRSHREKKASQTNFNRNEIKIT